MMLKPWDQLPDYMQTDAVRPYYDVLANKRFSLAVKRIVDILVALILLVILGMDGNLSVRLGRYKDNKSPCHSE